MSLVFLLQFNDTLLYTTPVQSGQYKFNNMLSLAGMKVRTSPHISLHSSSLLTYILLSQDMLYAAITAHNENNYRLASQARRPIRTSWRLRAWSAPSSSQRGNDQKPKISPGNLRTCCFIPVVLCFSLQCKGQWIMCRCVFTLCFLSAVRPQSEMSGSRLFPRRSVNTPGRRSVLYLASLQKRWDNNLEKVNLVHFLFLVCEPVW